MSNDATSGSGAVNPGDIAPPDTPGTGEDTVRGGIGTVVEGVGGG